MIERANQIANYDRYHTRDICATIRLLSPEEKQRLLDEINLRKGVRTFMGQDYDQEKCKYIESLLNGKQPKK